jgi:tetratricopeptide (TPR) repeat protein
MIINDFNSAKDYLEQAISLNPDFSDSYWFAGINYLNFNYINEGLSYINQALDRGYVPSSVEQAMSMINYAAQTKDYQTIVRLYNIVINIDPNNPQNYANLATTYALMGNKEKAIESAKKAAEFDPSYKAESDSFIQQVEQGTFKINDQ